jgi:hypothetical protein
MYYAFTWDSAKEAANRHKHGVSFVEAASAFWDPLGVFVEDGVFPDRTILLGMSDRDRLLVIVHVETNETEIRIISARSPTAHERRRHEDGT